MDDAIDRALSTSPETLDTMRRAGHELVKKLTPVFAGGQMLAAAKTAVAGRDG
jgi:hypothetical protein